MATSKKISAQMATSIALDTVSAAKSLKSLQSSISATATAWKTLSAQQKSSGDEMASLQTKARGLQEVYDKQSQKIAQLKSRQDELTKGLGENGKMSESTAQKYLRLQNQIERLQAQQVSEKKQIDQTNQAIKYHESGLAGLQNQMKQNQAVTSSLVQRLQAEGKERKALKAQLDGEKSSLNNLNQQYKIQESELNSLRRNLVNLNSEYTKEKRTLDSIAISSGKSSKEYQDQATKVKALQRAVTQANSDFKTQQTRLNNTGTALAKTKTKVSELRSSYLRLPKSVTTKINADTAKAKSNVSGFTSVLKGVSIGSMVAQVGMKALQVVTDNFGDAVSRYDTLNNFPKVLESMGASADDAKASMELLKKGVDGLPTSLDTVAKTSEKLLPMSKNAQDASKSALALNDAFLASKASEEDASRGLEQYSQMLSAGKVDLQSWKTLQETMPAALTKVAKSFGIASGSTKELYDQLKSGKITIQQLNEKFQELDQGADGFHQQALQASDGIGTAFANMKNRTVKALTSVLEGFDNLVKSVTGSSLAQNINNISAQFGNFGDTAKKAIEGLEPIVKKMIPVFQSFGRLVGAALSGLKPIFSAVKDSFKSFTDSGSKGSNTLKDAIDKITPVVRMLSNVIGTVLATAIRIVTPIIKGLVTVIGTIADVINNVVKYFGIFAKTTGEVFGDFGKGVSNTVKGFNDCMDNMVNWVVKTAGDIGKWFKDMAKGISDSVENAKKWAKEKWNDMCDTIKTKTKDFKEDIQSKWNDLKDKVSTTTETLKETAKSKWNNMCKTVSDKTKAFKEDIQSKWKDMKEKVSTTTENLKETAKSKWNTMCTNIKTFTDNFKSSIQTKWNNMKSKVSEITENLKETAKTKWNTMCTNIKSFTDNFKSSIQSKWNDMKSKVSTTTENLKETAKSKWNSMCNTINSRTGTFKSNVQSKWNDMKNKVGTTVQNLSSDAKSKFNSMYNQLNSMTNGGLDRIHRKWSDTWTKIGSVVKSAVRNVGNSVVDVVNGAIKPLNKMLDGIKNGVNWVLDKFGASKWSGFSIPTVPHFATGGIVGGGAPQKGKGTFALVNDAPGKNYREMFATPDGKLGMFPKERNFMTWLPHGTQVLPGEQSKALADMLGIPQYKDGTKDKNIFQKIFDKGWDMLKEVGNIIAHPIKFLEKVLLDKIKVSTKVKVASEVIKHAPHTVATWGKEWLKKMAEDWKKKKDEEASVGGFGNIPDVVDGQNLRDLVKKALEANGLSTDEGMISKVMRQIATESGGNAHAVQPGADPDHDGSGPALGLMQTKRATFNAYKAPGHDDIFNAYDNLLAALNYAKHRYGPSLSFLGQGHGYANGGFINMEQLATVGEQNKPEVIIPLSSEKQGRALDLLTQTVNRLNRNNGRNTKITNVANDNSGLEDKLDKVITLLGSILGVSEAQLSKNNNNSLTGLYQQMYRDQQLNNYQSI